MTDRNYTELMQELETLKQEQAQAAGARKELLKQLHTEFGLDGVKAAQAKIEELKKKKKALERKRDEEYRKLMEHPAWKGKLQDSED